MKRNRRILIVGIFTCLLLASFGSRAAGQIVATIPLPGNSMFFVDVNPNTNTVYTSGGASFGQVVTMIDGNTNLVIKTIGTGSGAHVNPATNKLYAGAVFSPFATTLVYSGVDGHLIKGIATFDCPISAVVDSSINRIWGGSQCGSFNDPVYAIDGSTDTLISGPIGSGGVMGEIVVNPVTHTLYMGPSGVSKKVNPNTFAVSNNPFSGIVLAVNPATNRLYATAGPLTQVIDGSSEAIITTLSASGSVAVNPARNRVYVADSPTRSVKVFDGTTHALIGSIPAPGGTSLGDIAVNRTTGKVYVIDFVAGGANLLVIDDGLVTDRPPVARVGPDQVIECSSHMGTLVTLDGSKSSDPDGDPLTFEWTDTHANVIGTTAVINRTLPLGVFTFFLTVIDPGVLGSTATTHVTVRDTTPPALSVSLSPNVLWPPNHKFVPITANIQVSDICDPSPRVVLVSITSNEPGVAGDVQGAVFGTDVRSFLLRAERLGTGTGRIYTATFRASDASGNMSFASATVTLPHDQRKR